MMSRSPAAAAASRRLLTVALLVAPTLLPLVPLTAAGAQGAVVPPPQQRRWTAVRVAKWATLGAAVGFGFYALSHSRRADRWYDALRTLCHQSPQACSVEDGRYVAADAESLYRESTREDRRAQVGILGGQVTLLGSVALFVYDLRNDRGPQNIPYPGSGAYRSTLSGPPGVALGATVNF